MEKIEETLNTVKAMIESAFEHLLYSGTKIAIGGFEPRWTPTVALALRISCRPCYGKRLRRKVLGVPFACKMRLKKEEGVQGEEGSKNRTGLQVAADDGKRA